LPRKKTTPAETLSDQQITRIRKRYKKDVTKRRKLVLGQKEFISDMTIILKLANYSNTQIAKIVGISRGQVKEIIEDHRVAERLTALRRNVPAAALEIIQLHMIEAAQTVIAVMRESQDDAIVLKAAAEIFDRGGLAKTSRTEKVEEQHHVHTWDEQELTEKLRDASPEVKEKAAQMIEDMEKMLAEAQETNNEATAEAEEQ
jgi:hypothetical protein